MNIFLEDNELDEIPALSPSTDTAIHIEESKRGIANSDIVKEIAAVDALDIGPTKSSEVNGVLASSASKYSNGIDIANEDARARILARRHNIQDTATAKLMDTLDLIKPSELTKIKDRVTLMNGLSSLIEKIEPSGDKNTPNQVHLHLYAPSQKKESDYDTIEA